MARKHPSTIAAPLTALGCALAIFCIGVLAGFGLYTLIRFW